MPILNNIGAIASLNIPEGWVCYPGEELPGERQLQKISPYADAQVVFFSCVRGVELSNPGKEALMRTLYNNFHALNEREIFDLREVLEGMANGTVFAIGAAYTTYLNSRRIIRVTGEWTELKRKEDACFLDLSGNSQNIQQLSLLAPVEDFAKYAALVEREILLLLQWHK